MADERLVDCTGRRSILDLRGKQFGRLQVLELVTDKSLLKTKSVETGAAWLCQCECGNTKIVSARSLNHGDVSSCGCLALEVRTKLGLARGGFNSKPDSALRELYGHYVSGSKQRKRCFELTIESFQRLTQQNCAYCGSPPAQMLKRRSSQPPYIYNGIDRVDNSVGYIEGNCVPCCRSCNTAKARMGELDFANWACRVVDHWARAKSQND